MEESTSYRIRMPGFDELLSHEDKSFRYSPQSRKHLQPMADLTNGKSQETSLVCRFKAVPCPNTNCKSFAKYSINTYIECPGSYVEDPKIYDMFSSLYSDSLFHAPVSDNNNVQSPSIRSELACSCTNPHCPISRLNWRLPILPSICTQCDAVTGCVVSLCGFVNFNPSNVTSFLTGDDFSKFKLQKDNFGLEPLVYEYNRQQEPLTERSIQFVAVSMCLKRKHVFYSNATCPVKNCCNPAIPYHDAKTNKQFYQCLGLREGHQPFVIQKEVHPGICDQGIDPTCPRNEYIKCPFCLTANPAIPHDSTNPNNWMKKLIICSNARCRLMWS